MKLGERQNTWLGCVTGRLPTSKRTKKWASTKGGRSALNSLPHSSKNKKTVNIVKRKYMNTIEDKIILVTGANRGIGRALVEESLRRGAKRVYAGTRGALQHPDKRVTPLTLDVTKPGRIMKNQNYTASFTVDQSPKEIFNAINNVRGWWSEEIEGRTDRAGAEWTYRYKDVHHCKMKIIEFIPGQKVVWLVVDNLFNFTKDKTEWKGTEIIFEISKKGKKTEVRFTHQGLVPEYECFDVCSDAWGSYIKGSLRNLIVEGKGQPNPLEKVVAKARKMSRQDYTTSFTVGQTPKEVFDAINNVRGWWSGEVEGNTDKLGAEFTYRVPDAHRSKQKVTDFVPGKKVVWHVSDARLDFVKDKNEWKGTEIVFDIAKNGDKTEVRFTHIGLAPACECYDG